MSICKTDLHSEFNFREQAEAYRYYFVQALNKNMMLKSKENEFKSYKIHKAEFSAISDFHYTDFNLIDTFKNKQQEFLALVALLAGMLFVIKTKLKNV